MSKLPLLVGYWIVAYSVNSLVQRTLQVSGYHLDWFSKPYATLPLEQNLLVATVFNYLYFILTSSIVSFYLMVTRSVFSLISIVPILAGALHFAENSYVLAAFLVDPQFLKTAAKLSLYRSDVTLSACALFGLSTFIYLVKRVWFVGQDSRQKIKKN
jgi:hypothetical protein